MLLLLAAAVVLTVCFARFRSPAPRRDATSALTIFMSVASYRDDRCATTLWSAWRTAQQPQRVTVGVVDQRLDTDPPCVLSPIPSGGFGQWLHRNVRVRRVPLRDARGPTYARFVATLMFRGEDFFMMVDAHNVFTPRWDAVAIGMYRAAAADATHAKVVLSAHPLAWHGNASVSEALNTRDEGKLMLCACGYPSDLGLPVLYSRVLTRRLTAPRQTPFACAGLLFAPGTLLQDVPFDPYLDFVFLGEEILYSARMWTHGYDLYAPHKNLLFHRFADDNAAPRLWDDGAPQRPADWQAARRVSEQRMQAMLRITAFDADVRLMSDADAAAAAPRVALDAATYGVGASRSIDDYWRYAKINTRLHHMDSEGWGCVP
jgi:UDP-GlcNAc:polypeptide alpha-N-acetylglucosaminyltransferase